MFVVRLKYGILVSASYFDKGRKAIKTTNQNEEIYHREPMRI